MVDESDVAIAALKKMFAADVAGPLVVDGDRRKWIACLDAIGEHNGNSVDLQFRKQRHVVEGWNDDQAVHATLNKAVDLPLRPLLRSNSAARRPGTTRTHRTKTHRLRAEAPSSLVTAQRRR